MVATTTNRASMTMQWRTNRQLIMVLVAVVIVFAVACGTATAVDSPAATDPPLSSNAPQTADVEALTQQVNDLAEPGTNGAASQGSPQAQTSCELEALAQELEALVDCG